MKTWQLQEAKARFSFVVKEAMTHGPQEISLRGAPVVIVIAKQEYDKLKKKKASLVQLMRQSPLVETQILLKRHRSLTRRIIL